MWAKRLLQSSCRFWWPLLQVCSQTKECQVYQFVPHASMLRQSASVHLKSLQQFPDTPSWSDTNPSKELKLCTIAVSFCSPARNIFQRGPRDRFFREVSPTLATFQVLQQKFVIQPISSISSTLGWGFAFFQPFFCHPRIRMRIDFAVDAQISIPNSVLFPVLAPTELPRTVFTTRALQVDVLTDVVQQEPLDLQCLTMNLAICVVVDVSIYLCILTLELWAILQHPPFFYLGVSSYCVGCLSCTVWWPYHGIHFCCGRHLWCWRTSSL